MIKKNTEGVTIAESFTLPSQGKVYPELIDPQVTLRSMQTAEELRRLSPSQRQYATICSIIDDCMIEGPQMSSYDMCMGDYQFLLYKLRIVTYGPEFEVQSYCPLCKSENVAVLDLDNMLIKQYTEDIEKYRTFELPVSKKKVKIKMQTPRMMDDIKERSNDFKRKQEDKSIDYTLLFTLEKLIDTVDGKQMLPGKLTEWIRTLPMRDTNTIINYSDKLESMLGIDRNLTNECDICGYTYGTQLSLDKTFFRPALDI